MGVNSKYFVKSGVSIKDIETFLEKTYGNVVDWTRDQDYGDEFQTVSGVISFGKDDPHTVFVHVPGHFCDEGPVNGIAGQSIFLSASAMEKDVAILTSIARHFGGYICKNDCVDEDSPDYWKYISAENDVSATESEIEGKIYQLVAQYKENGHGFSPKNSPKIRFLTQFILDNLEEIRKL